MSYINKRFYNEYILVLHERHQYDRQSRPHLQIIPTGVTVLVKDVNFPSLCWEKGRRVFLDTCITYK